MCVFIHGVCFIVTYFKFLFGLLMQIQVHYCSCNINSESQHKLIQEEGETDVCMHWGIVQNSCQYGDYSVPYFPMSTEQFGFFKY